MTDHDETDDNYVNAGTNASTPGAYQERGRPRQGPRSDFTKAHAFNKLISLAGVIDIPDCPVFIEYTERGRWVLCIDDSDPAGAKIHYRSKGPVFNQDGSVNTASFDLDEFATEDPNAPIEYPQDYLDDTRFRFLDALREFGGEWSKIAYIMIGALRENNAGGPKSYTPDPGVKPPAQRRTIYGRRPQGG